MLRRKHYSAKTQVIKTSVPYGSTKVEWLESVDNEYILCGNVNYKVGDIIETSALQQLTVLDGVRRSEGRNANLYDGTYYFWGVIENNTYYAGTGTWGETSFPADFEWHIFRNKCAAATHNPGFYVDDTKIRNGGIMSNNWEKNNIIGLWKTTNGSFSNLLSKKKWWKLSLNNKVIYNLIPSIDKTGTPCMFDLVSRKNFYNAGTGQFKYIRLNGLPSDYTQVEYLEGSGTQWMEVPISTTGGDDVNVSFQGNYTRIDKYQEEGAQKGAHTAPYFQIGLRANGVWCGGVIRFVDSSKNSDKEEHLFEIVSQKECSGVKIDGTFIISQNPITSGAITTRMGIWRSVLPNMLYPDLSFNRKKWWKLTVNEEMKYNLIPCLDPTGTPCMYDTITQTPFYNVGTGDFLYPSPTSSTTYSMRRPQAEYAKMTDTGVRRLYHVPVDYEDSIENYASENGYKRLIETESPIEEGKHYAFRWVETDTELITEWYEVDPPTDELDNSFDNEPQSSTFNLRRPAPIDNTVYTNNVQWAKMTDTGVHKIYHTPIGYEGSIENYAIENGYKRLIETESPNEEGKYYSFKWVETDDTLTTEWFEIDPPQEEFFEENLDNSQNS